MEMVITIIKAISAIILLCVIGRLIYVNQYNEHHQNIMLFDKKTLLMIPYPKKKFVNLNKKHIMKVFDVVKWNKPQNPTEEKDIMVIKDLYGTQAVEVIHLNNNSISVEMVNNLIYKAHANSIEDARKKFVK